MRAKIQIDFAYPSGYKYVLNGKEYEEKAYVDYILNHYHLTKEDIKELENELEYTIS